MLWRIVRWSIAVLLWLFGLLSALLAGFLVYMEGRWAIWCGDDICEGGIPGAIALGAIAVLAFGLGWLAKPRPVRDEA